MVQATGTKGPRIGGVVGTRTASGGEKPWRSQAKAIDRNAEAMAKQVRILPDPFVATRKGPTIAAVIQRLRGEALDALSGAIPWTRFRVRLASRHFCLFFTQEN